MAPMMPIFITFSAFSFLRLQQTTAYFAARFLSSAPPQERQLASGLSCQVAGSNRTESNRPTALGRGETPDRSAAVNPRCQGALNQDESPGRAERLASGRRAIKTSRRNEPSSWHLVAGPSDRTARSRPCAPRPPRPTPGPPR